MTIALKFLRNFKKKKKPKKEKERKIGPIVLAHHLVSIRYSVLGGHA